MPLFEKAVKKLEEDRRAAVGENCEDVGSLSPFIVTEDSLNWGPVLVSVKRSHDGTKMRAK